MKATSLLSIIIMMSGINAGITQGIVNTGSDIYISTDTYFTMTSDFTNLNNGIFINQGKLIVLENWENNGNTEVIALGTSGTTIFEGVSSQNIFGSHSSHFNNLEIENDLNLFSNIEVLNSLKINSGKINIKDNDLKYSGSSAIVFSPDNYLIAEESGKLKMDIAFSSTQLFPIGTATSYVPVAISNNASADEFAVNVMADVLENGDSGMSIQEIQDCVGISWDVSSSDTSNVDYSVELQWNLGNEGTSFDRVYSAVGEYYSGKWNPNIQSAATGTDPYYLSLGNVKKNGVFAIGDLESPMTLPLHLTLDLEAILEGAFVDIEMETKLKDNELIPLAQPYNMSPWDYSGTEMVTSIPADVVDWVLIETRDAPDAVSANANTKMERQAAFLLKDGSIVSIDGNAKLSFDNYATQKLFVLIHHRNHLSIMSAFSLTHVEGIYAYDFTLGSAQAYTNTADGQKEIVPGIWGMIAGDGNRDGMIDEYDYQETWLPSVGTNSYQQADYNLNAEVNNQDKNDYWINNLNASTQIPQ